MKFTCQACMLAVAAVFSLAAVTAHAQPSLEVRQDRLQLQADRAALQRQMKRLAADEAKLKTDIASGRMSAQSKDSYEVYRAKQAVEGAKENVADHRAASLQMRADRVALQRQLIRLDIAERRLAADKASGKMAAETKGSMAVAASERAVTGARAAVATGQPGSLQMKADEAGLRRALARLEADEAQLKADRAAGKISADSKDAYAVYQARQAVRKTKESIADDEAVRLQMAADRATLQRQLKRLEVAEARLSANKASGNMAAESKNSINVSRGQQAVKAQKAQIAADRADLKADRNK